MTESTPVEASLIAPANFRPGRAEVAVCLASRKPTSQRSRNDCTDEQLGKGGSRWHRAILDPKLWDPRPTPASGPRDPSRVRQGHAARRRASTLLAAVPAPRLAGGYSRAHYERGGSRRTRAVSQSGPTFPQAPGSRVPARGVLTGRSADRADPAGSRPLRVAADGRARYIPSMAPHISEDRPRAAQSRSSATSRATRPRRAPRAPRRRGSAPTSSCSPSSSSPATRRRTSS